MVLEILEVKKKILKEKEKRQAEEIIFQHQKEGEKHHAEEILEAQASSSSDRHWTQQ